jgi:hypothetical protein
MRAGAAGRAATAGAARARARGDALARRRAEPSWLCSKNERGARAAMVESAIG